MTEERFDQDPVVEPAPMTSPEREPAEHLHAIAELKAQTEQDPPLQPSEERTLSLFAHLGIFLNLFVPMLGLVVPGVIYLAYRHRSKYVAYQSLQALVFQAVFVVGAGALAGVAWAAGAILTLVLVGLCIFPFALLLSLVPIAAGIYAIFAAIDTYNGRDFKYWMVGDWVRKTYTGE